MYTVHIFINMSITCVLVFQILSDVEFLILLVKLFPTVKALNIDYKSYRTSKSTRNRYFQKTRALCSFRRLYESICAPLHTSCTILCFPKQFSYTPLTLDQRAPPLNPLFNLVPPTPLSFNCLFILLSFCRVQIPP